MNDNIVVRNGENGEAHGKVSEVEVSGHVELIVPVEVDKICSEELESMVVVQHPNLKSTNANLTEDPHDSLQEEAEQNNKNKSTEFVVVAATLVDCSDNDESTGNVAVSTHVKDELAEHITTDIACPDVLENDPMGLLELNDRSEINCSSRSNGDQGEGGDDVSSTGSSSVHTTSSSSNVLEWCKEYSWLLYEESDEMYGYCLYCDAKLNVRSISSVKQHGLSLYHKERSDNYLAFREEEERNDLGTPLIQIKQEFGTDSYIAALKLKRKTQAEALNNFNWRRWLDECPWLDRENPAGTIGHCKYCGIQLNVEFSYLRIRHQETGKHKESAKQYEQTKSNTNDQTSDKNAEAQSTDVHNDSRSNERYRWCQPLKGDHNTVRCKICDTKMAKNNYPRHLRTNLHLQNEKQYLNCLKREKSKRTKAHTNLLGNKAVSSKTDLTWSMYAKQHPWLIPDPSDATNAFCKYCEKRILYGNSVAKRATHENSIQHKYHEKIYKETNAKGTEQEDAANGDASADGDGSEENDRDDDEDDKMECEEEGENEENDEDEDDEVEEGEELGDNEEQEENKEGDEEEEDEEDDEQVEEQYHENRASEDAQDSADNNDSRKRIYRTDSEWYDQYSWCKKYKADPVNYFFCSYCKIAIGKSCRKKHSVTARHLAAEAEYLKRQNKKKSLIRSKVSEDTFDWAVDIKSQPNLYYCKYCRVRISRHYSKKQHAVSKIHQINENLYNSNRRKSVKSEVNVETNTPDYQQRGDSSSATKPVVKVPSLITLVKQWQKKSTWLTYKRNELRSNYAFCKVCNQSLYIRSIKNVLKHQRSSKHIRTVNQLRRQQLQQERELEESQNTQVNQKDPKLEVEPNTPIPPQVIQKGNPEELNNNTKESPKDSIYKSTIGEMQKRFSWIEKSRKPQYAYCRYCNSNIALKILFLRNHSNSKQHRQAVVNYRVAKTKSDKQHLIESNADNGDDDDIVLVEDNAEEILISEQDDNWTVKSENMDEHEALDYLLQRSGKTNDSNESRKERKLSTAEDRPSKRVKRSHSFRRLNESNSSLVASILSTPLTLASCLGPLIQQQIQQVTNTQQSLTPPLPSNPVSVEPDNSFDLFFKSISETMKKLPIDLAAEGKLKVMQIICDLELKALKRQQQTNADTDILESNSNINVSSLVQTNPSNSNVPEEGAETNCRIVPDTDTTPLVQCDNVMNETVITPVYTNINTSPTRNQQHQIGPAAATTSFSVTPTDATKGEKSLNSNQSPIIGVMDKNGLHTLQFKNTTMVKQIPKGTITAKNSSTIGNSPIRCIPFKNLTQSVSTEGNTTITRIQVPISSATTVTSQNPQSTVNLNTTNVTNTSKSLLNMRSIHITKRSTPVQHQALPSVVSPVVTTTISDMNAQGAYITASNVQRWTTVNGSSPTATTKTQSSTPNFNLSAKQTSTPVVRNYK